eukprot:1003785-Amphidinium_carterae.1
MGSGMSASPSRNSNCTVELIRLRLCCFSGHGTAELKEHADVDEQPPVEIETEPGHLLLYRPDWSSTQLAAS